MVASDGQVSMGNTVIKRTANKVLTPQRNIAKGNIDVDKFYTYYSEIITGQKLNKQKFLSELAIICGSTHNDSACKFFC